MANDCNGETPSPSSWRTTLEKAQEDHFTYLLRLRTGELVHFAKASMAGDFVHLTDCRILFPPDLADSRFDRGMDVRKDAIVWVADDGYFDGV